MKRCWRRMDGIVAPKSAAWEGNVYRGRRNVINRLQQNKGRIERLRRPSLMLLFSNGAALVGF